MPEALGGRPPTLAEQGKEKLEHVKQRVDDETRIAKEKIDDTKQRVQDETRSAQTEVAGQPSLIEQGKELYKEVMPEVLGGRPLTLEEQQQHTVEGAKSLPAQVKELYKDTMPQFLGGRPPTIAEEFKEMIDNSKQRTHSLDGQMKDLSIDNRHEDTVQDKPLTDQLKTMYKENMPEALGGRPETMTEKVKQRMDDEVRSAKEIGQKLGKEDGQKLIE
eukprot:TRINITY_DN897_c0_g1_i13.p1 TRINITY_DN897_c0_g1~~TRINITY_DN897_c0_g1_i13.p1  ORF type:complete len:218 (-),score=24.92 TRINITY_DN897_c0_g1_i13:137-790(-)